MRTIYGDLIRLRKAHSSFSNDDVVWLQNSAPAEVVTFMRKDAKDEFVVIINLSSRRVTGSVELDDTDGFDAVKVSGMPEPVSARLPDFTLKSYGWFIYHRSLGK